MADATPLRVLGVDPGLSRCGIGIVEGSASSPRLCAHRCVRTDPAEPLEQRLLAVHTALVEVIGEFAPTAMAVEQVLFSKNVRTAMATGQAAGVALLAGAQAGLTVAAYTPTEVKLTVAGSGTADKDGVARMVAAQLGVVESFGPADVTDALAVAITHLARSRLSRAASSPAAAETLQAAHAAAQQARRGGWEAVLGDRLAAASAPRTGRGQQ
ncbi:MAG: crossover junction endodeoxyribonuclease RuvC [Nitriliruptoraceae bacterium]